MPFDADDVRAALLAKGMTRDPNHHEMFRKEIKGVTTIVTRLSWKGRRHQIPDHLASAMARQTCRQLGEFKKLISCVLSGAEWDRLIVERCAGGAQLARGPMTSGRPPAVT